MQHRLRCPGPIPRLNLCEKIQGNIIPAYLSEAEMLTGSIHGPSGRSSKGSLAALGACLVVLPWILMGALDGWGLCLYLVLGFAFTVIMVCLNHRELWGRMRTSSAAAPQHGTTYLLRGSWQSSLRRERSIRRGDRRGEFWIALSRAGDSDRHRGGILRSGDCAVFQNRGTNGKALRERYFQKAARFYSAGFSAFCREAFTSFEKGDLWNRALIWIPRDSTASIRPG